MKNYCGIDLGCESTVFCVVDEVGTQVAEDAVKTDAELLKAAFSKYSPLHCIVEAAPLAEWLCAVVESCGHTIHVVDSRQAKAVTHSKKKTDKIDARKLAQLARTGWYNVVHRKSGKARELRSFMTGRNQLVKIAQQAAACVRGILRAHGIKLSSGGGGEFEKNVQAALANCSPALRQTLLPLLKMWKEAHAAERAMYRMIPKVTRHLPEVELLQSVPGIGPATAAVFVATIDDPKRFTSAEKVASYLGLVPSIHQSGETEYRGRITRDGDWLLRWLLVEAANVLLSITKEDHHPLKEWGLRLQAAKGPGKARVAVARKLACLLYRVWRTGEPYRYMAAAA